MKPAVIISVLAVSLSMSGPAHALYKWVDENGVTHYGETIPPQYANQDRIKLEQGWRVTGKEEVLTAEERAQRRQLEREEAERRRLEKELRREQRRRDQAILNTYTTPQEIDLAKQRNMGQVDARIVSIQSRARIMEGKIDGLKQESLRFTQAGKPLPKSLILDIQETLSRLERLNDDLKKAHADKQAIAERFESDKQRFIQLKQIGERERNR